MKHTTFLFIGLFLLLTALLYQPLYSLFPDLIEPIYKFINDVGADILYIAGFLALIIALFSWLPTWASISLFVVLMFAGGYYLSDKTISIKIDDITLL